MVFENLFFWFFSLFVRFSSFIKESLLNFIIIFIMKIIKKKDKKNFFIINISKYYYLYKVDYFN